MKSGVFITIFILLFVSGCAAVEDTEIGETTQESTNFTLNIVG